ncbi:metallophosphoesterase [Sphingomonas sp. NSE70-1]|uniref:Metallophosphoesterase n=1 Tax=Sphingomonas caseinilyticus TaxID=2908205 RepID=A0ABT0RYL0_9SPHN|nr:metallophosphoesterase [Sphingomonas caseinilyticus]MCL6699780.1 metallophosphoesterase [Sphingomonas caseinilyticus]
MLRLLVWHLMVIAAALIPSAAVPQPAPQRIVAIGDLHGDFEAWRAIAAAAGIADAKGQWTGGNATLVQVGDVVDRGPDSLKIIQDLMRLQKEAPRRGGRVVALLGNHEAMMMTDDMRYVHPGEYAAFADRDSKGRRDRNYEINKTAIEAAYRARTPDMSAAAIKEEWMKITPLGKIEYTLAWRPDGELGRWALDNPAVVKLGDSLFVHGGISSAYASQSVEDINRKVSTALKTRNAAPTAIINDPQGPLWYRGLVVRNDSDAATVAPVPPGSTVAPTILEEIDMVLRNYGVKRIVVGHTPTREGIIEGAGGKLWRTDSAISRAYGGKLTYLEIIGDRVTAHEVPRPASKPWSTQ